MSSTRLSALLDGILEAGWLAAIIVTPLFFNIYSSRVFEPDKLTTLRSIALVMASAWLIRWVEEWFSKRDQAPTAAITRLTWRTPLVLPTLFTVMVYLVSNLLSVTSYVSFFGSYQRLQGTFTTLSYIVVFLVILDRMRTRAQVDRFITTLIINSLPIALYGFVQHSRRDPLPWGGDVTQRVASNMGNPIFVAAYLIMAAPPTLARVVDSFRSILTDKETGSADVFRAAAYIFIFLVQVITVWYSQSRGPLMGLLAGLAAWAFLGLLTLQRMARQEQPFHPRDLPGDLGRGAAFGLGSLSAAGAAAAILYIAGKTFATPESNLPQWIAAIAALLVFLGIWLAFIVNRRGWQWLWISALAIALLSITGFLAINLVEPIHEWSQEQPWLGRLDDVLQAESGTGKVRALIWEGALQLILPHEPIEYPQTIADTDGHPDRFNFLRPLIGYGPESMYVAYNSFYPPILGHYESRTASPDRSHNETLDSIVITGLLGFAAYLWLFGSTFALGLRWLGFLPAGWRRAIFFALLVVGAVAAAVAVIFTIGPHFFGLAVPIGMIGGLFVYLIVYGFSMYREPEGALAFHPHLLLLTGILATSVAHFVEANFGISIAATRTTFWALAGMFVVLGLQQVVAQEELPRTSQTAPQPQGKRRRKRRRQTPAARPRKARTLGAPAWLWPSLGAALVGSLILVTLVYDFINNVERLTNPVQIFFRSLAVIAIGGPPRISMGILMVSGLTWAATVLLSVAQMAKRGVFREHRGEEWAAALVVLVVPLAVGVTFGLVLAGRHAHIAVAGTTLQTITDAVDLASYVSQQVTLYYFFMAAVLLLGGLALMGEQALSSQWATISGVLVAVVLLVLVPVAAYRLNLRNIQADIVYKQASSWENEGQWVVAVKHYERSIELAPQEDFYYLYLGRALLEYASSLDPTQPEDAAEQELVQQEQDLVLRETERVLLEAQAINPLNTDHSANLARMYRRWYDLPSGRDYRQTLADLSSRYYEAATSLSPNNAKLWNEWALLYLFSGDLEQAQEKLAHSLELDPEFDETWTFQADVYISQNLIPEAIAAYGRALELNPRLTDVWLRLGDIYVNQNQLEEAVTAYEQALELSPNHIQVWRVLGSVYAQLGRPDAAITALDQALTLAPESSDAWDTHRMLAIIYSQLGQNDTALSHAQTAWELAPEEQQPSLESLIQQLQQPLLPEEIAP